LLFGFAPFETPAYFANPPAITSKSRGYVTTPAELMLIAEKASQGIEPYKTAVARIEQFANGGSPDPNPTFWPFGTIGGSQSCHGTLTPPFLGHGAPFIEAKAIVYGLLVPRNPNLAREYAAVIRAKLLELATTNDYGGNVFSGSNQCILNLSWYVPAWIIAADLIADGPGWTANDKQLFQQWLAQVVYKKVEWASDARSNNWGAAGSATSAMIADFLSGSGITVIDRQGRRLSPADAFQKAKHRQLDRMNGNSYMDNYNCHQPSGIRPDGGIPEELARGSSGCDAKWVAERDKSWTYTMTYLQGIVMHGELLHRRGDNSIYDNTTPQGGGSLLRAVHFLLDNPNGSSESPGWKLTNDAATLEFAYRYYRDPAIAKALGIGTNHRWMGGVGGQMLYFGTITHGFAPNENPGLVPNAPPPN